MDVQTQTLSNFDLNSKSPLSSSHGTISTNTSEVQSPAFRSSEMPLSSPTDALESDGSKAREAAGVPACEWSETDESLATDRLGREIAPLNFESSAAMRMQKVYRSYRTRRMLADSAVVAEELWWQAIDFARLNHSTISFFNFFKPETAASRWNRIGLNASKVGKGLSKDAKAQKLAFQHWIEAIDPRHRYGHSLHLYYEEWCKTDAGQPFFYWLDIGSGKDVDLRECPRSKLRQQCIKYLGPQERENYQYIVVEGKIVHKLSGNFLDTSQGKPGAKWIFVMSTSKKLYAGQKKKGSFHHSSFLAGGATLAAGRLEVEDGTLKSISRYSGHYRPTDDSLDILSSFLEENGVKLDGVEIREAKEDYEENKLNTEDSTSEFPTDSESSQPVNYKEVEKDASLEPPVASQTETKNSYQRTLSGGLQSPRAMVPQQAILQRINSKKAASSYQLGRQLSRKWSTGVGPRIGCVADYPVELRLQALELVNLSPRTPTTPLSYQQMAGLASPTAIPGSNLRTDESMSAV